MSVHRRQKIGRRVDFENPRPFGVPAVRPVVTVRPFREAVKAPFPVVEKRENNGTIIPAERPKRVVFRVRAVDSALRRYFRKLLAQNDLPIAVRRFFRETAGRNVRIDARFRRILAVVRVNEPALRRIAALAVITGKNVGAVRTRAVAVGIKLFHRERFDVDFVKPLFHREDINLVFRVG